MNQKLEELRAWGCDVDAAMRRMLDDEEFYLECLASIPEDQYFSALERGLKAHDISAAFDCAHTLKGILANVGLTPMYNKVVEIVEPLRAGHDEQLLEKYDALAKMKDKLSYIIKK